MKIVGLTGGIGSGKTTVAKLFEKRNIPVYYADDHAKYLMKRDKTLRQNIKELLGEKAYNKEGKINRSWIAERIFNNSSLLQNLNALVHPIVQRDFQRWMALQNSPYVLKEAAILIESGFYTNCDRIIVVTAALKNKIKRMQHRDNISLKNIQLRIKNQITDNERIKYASYVIENNSTIEILEKQVKKIHNKMLSIS